MKKIYLAGTIAQGHSKDCRGWREEVQDRLAGKAELVDPLRGKMVKDWTRFEPNEIVHRDLADMDKCDVVLMNLTVYPNYVNWGSACEMMYAWLHRKPMIFVCNSKQLRNHYWVRVLSAKIFSDLEDAIKYIEEFWL